MKQEDVSRLYSGFEAILQKDVDADIEFWYARDLQEILGYSEWRNFEAVVRKAITSCENSGYDPRDHFVNANKKVLLGSGAEREIVDIALTRYACYLVAQNGDPKKTEIAFAQTYFAVQTRKQELIEERLAEIERLIARKKLTVSEKELSQIIFERVGDERSFGRIRSKGDRALFGGLSTKDMKIRLDVPNNRPLADFLPTITIKAKDFATEITNFNIHKDDLNSENQISNEHVKNNEDVRKILTDRNIVPEQLPPAEDIKKIERKVKSEQKKLPNQTKGLPDANSD